MLASAHMFKDRVIRPGAAAVALFFVAIASLSAMYQRPPIAVAVAFQRAEMGHVARAPSLVHDLPLPELVAESGATPAPEPTLAWPEAAGGPAAAIPSEEPPTARGLALASWYGPGFFGKNTACGQIYTPETVGVAHRTLPCGTLLTLAHDERAVTVPVIDRGPFVAGRILDLTSATRSALGCADLCTLSMRLGQ